MPTVTYEVRGIEVRISCKPEELDDVLTAVERRAVAIASKKPSFIETLDDLTRRRPYREAQVLRPEYLAEQSAAGMRAVEVEESPSHSQSRVKLDGDNAYVRKEVIKQVLAEAGEPLPPKEIADRLRARDDFEMGSSSDWVQAVRYVLTRAYDDEFESPVRGKWRVADAPAPHHEEPALADSIADGDEQ